MALLKAVEQSPGRDPGAVSVDAHGSSTITVYETFGSGNLSAYTEDLESFEVVSSTAYDSSNSLRYIGQDNAFTWTLPVEFEGPTWNRILGGAGPSAETRIRMQWKVGSTFYDGAGFIFGATDVNNCYVCRANCGNRSIELVKWDDGTPAVIDDTQFDRADLTAGEWHTLEADFHIGGTAATNGELKGRLFDSNGSQVASASANDAEYTSGDFGWVARRDDGTEPINLDYLVGVS